MESSVWYAYATTAGPDGRTDGWAHDGGYGRAHGLLTGKSTSAIIVNRDVGSLRVNVLFSGYVGAQRILAVQTVIRFPKPFETGSYHLLMQLKPFASWCWIFCDLCGVHACTRARAGCVHPHTLKRLIRVPYIHTLRRHIHTHSCKALSM